MLHHSRAPIPQPQLHVGFMPHKERAQHVHRQELLRYTIRRTELGADGLQLHTPGFRQFPNLDLCNTKLESPFTCSYRKDQ